MGSLVVETEGNPACHVILRGANSGPNFSAEHVKKASEGLRKAKVSDKVMIDWYVLLLLSQSRLPLELMRRIIPFSSHGNSEKKHERQVLVAEDIARQLGSTETGEQIMGVMIESHLVEGKQSIPASGPHTLTYGQSITYVFPAPQLLKTPYSLPNRELTKGNVSSNKF